MGAMSPAKAQDPPATVPAESQIVADDANLALKKDLDSRYATLVQQFNAWNKEAAAFNAQYGGKNLDANTQEAKDGLAEQARVAHDLQDYQQAAEKFEEDVGGLRLESLNVRIARGIDAMAKRLGWSADKLDRLNKALNSLHLVGNKVASDSMINSTWQDIKTSSSDAELIQEASQNGGLGLPGAGKQSFSDCAVFALANAAGLPYGVVAARTNLLISQAEWRTDSERADPPSVFNKGGGLYPEEVVMLAESFGQAQVVPSSDFANTLTQDRPIMVGIGASTWGHEVVLTKTFQHDGATWYVMMDSSQNPDQRRFVSAGQLDTLLKENGVTYLPEPGTVPKLLRDGAGQ